MATLQKFKLLATQCAVVSSPSRSPTTSPVIHIRRRKTLRMLLGRSFSTHGGATFLRRFPDRHKSDKQPSQTTATTTTTKDHLNVRLKLKDLFISSPPPPILTNNKAREGEESKRLLPVSDASSGGELTVVRPTAGGSVRPLSATLRQRLLMRKIWRPALVAIPEQSP